MPSDDCIQTLTIISSGLSALAGIIVNELIHWGRSKLETRRLRSVAISVAKHEVAHQADVVDRIRHQYVSVLNLLSAGEQVDRCHARASLNIEHLERIKLRLIETGAEVNFVLGLNQVIDDAVEVEALRQPGLEILDQVINGYSKQHREYPGYRQNLKTLKQLQSALEAAAGAFKRVTEEFKNYPAI